MVLWLVSVARWFFYDTAVFDTAIFVVVALGLGHGEPCPYASGFQRL
jgi:hypothetical protein